MPVYDTNAWLDSIKKKQPKTTVSGIISAAVGGVARGMSETFETINSAAGWLEENFVPIPTRRIGVTRLGTEGLSYERKSSSHFIEEQNNLIDEFQKRLPTGDTMPERFVSSVAQIAAPMGIWNKALKVSGVVNQTTRMFAAGAIADFSAFDPYEKRLSNLLTEFDNPVANNFVTQYLAADEDDEEWEGRLKQTIEGGIFGAIAGTAVEGVMRAFNVVKGVRRAKKEIEDVATKRVEDPPVPADATKKKTEQAFKLEQRRALADSKVLDADEKDFIKRRFHERGIYPNLDILNKEKETLGNINNAYSIFRKKIEHTNSLMEGRLTGHSKYKNGELWLRLKTDKGFRWFPSEELTPKATIDNAVGAGFFKEIKGDTSKGIPLPGEIYERELLSNATTKAVLSGVDHIILGNKDEGVRLFKQVSEALNIGELQPDNVKEILTKYELSPQEFAKLFQETVSTSARNLAYLSHTSRRLSKVFEGDKEAAAMFDKQARKFRQDAYLTDKLAFGWQTLEDWRRSLLVTQLATAIRNTFSQGPRAVLGALDESLQAVIAAPVRQVYKGFGADVTGRSFKGDVLANLNSLSAFRGRLTKSGRQRLDDILDENPYQKSRLLNQPINEVSTANRVSQFLNTYNRAQEIFFRKFTFEAKLRQIAHRRGLDYDTLSAREITQEEFEEAVEYGLEMTFSASPKTQWAKTLVRFWSRTPLTLINPFPRFNFANALPFLRDHQPLALLKAANPKMYSKAMAIESADQLAKTGSRAAIGTGLLTLAWNVRDSAWAGENWHEINNPLNPEEIIDTRAYAPFSTYLFIAEAIRDNLAVMNGDRKEAKIPVKEYIKQAVAINRIAGTSLELVDMLKMEKGQSLVDMSKRIAGQYLASFSVPAKTAKDLATSPEGAAAAGGLFGLLRAGGYAGLIGTAAGYAYGELGSHFLQEEHILRDVKESPTWAPFVANIPGFSQVLPSDTNPIISTPVIDDAPDTSIFPGVETQQYKSEHPVLRQLSGLSVRPKSLVEREIDRLNVNKKRVWNSTGNARANRLLDGYTGQLRSILLNPIVESEYWKQMPEFIQRSSMRKLLRETKSKAMQLLALRHNDLWLELKYDRMDIDTREAYEAFGIELPGSTN